MKTIVYAALAITLVGCKGKEMKENTEPQKPDTTSAKFYKIDKKPEATGLQQKIMGTWTTDGFDNAVFDITKDSIYYLENNDTFAYGLNKNTNTITIAYPDDSISFGVYFIGDTLVLKSAHEGETKYWRFKE
jgi:hypothetical protein